MEDLYYNETRSTLAILSKRLWGLHTRKHGPNCKIDRCYQKMKITRIGKLMDDLIWLERQEGKKNDRNHNHTSK